jgi:hypothetical protein
MNALGLAVTVALMGAAPPKAPPQVFLEDASEPAQPATAPEIVFPPAAGACPALPKPRSGPPPFPAGEKLGYDVDVMGVRAGKMDFDVLPWRGRGSSAQIPIRVRVESNTFFRKVRKVKGEVVTHLRGRDLRPSSFEEDLHEGEIDRNVRVSFPETGEKFVKVEWKSNRGNGRTKNGYANDALDYLGAIYLFRAMPLRIGDSFCFDVYALRKMWRVEGRVESLEQVSTPAGEFDAFHLSGVAVRVGGSPMKREVHVWVSNDAYRLPVAAIGIVDLGPVRATLASVSRQDLKSAPARPDSLQW